MNVLQIANGFWGSKLYANLFNYLRRIGVETLIYVPVKKGETLEPDDASVRVFPCFTQLDRFLFFSKQKKIVCGIADNYDLSKIDIIHAHTLFSAGYAAYKLKMKHGIPYVVAVRNTDVNVFFKYMIHLRGVGMRVLRSASKVVFLSPAYQEQVLSDYVSAKFRDEIRSKSIVIPNGIADLFFACKAEAKRLPDSRSVRIIYVGNIDRNKNLEETVEAIRLLRDKEIAADLTVVGAIMNDKYRELINSNTFIEYYQKCEQEQVLEYLRDSDVFVMPSHTETFGLVYAEAMSQGLPVLYTKGQGFDGQFPDGTVGYAVSDSDAADLAAKVELTIENYEQLSKNCVELVDKFDWTQIAAQYKRLYENVIKGGSIT